MRPELIYYGGHKLTEATMLDKSGEVLYFVAIRYNTIFSLNLKNLSVKSFMTDGAVGGIAYLNGDLIEAEKDGIYRFDFDSGMKQKLAHIITYNKMRYNHIASDSRGRLLIDVIGDEERCEGKGGLYSLYDGVSRCIIGGTTVANGVCLSNDEKKLYFTDTPAQEVWSYDYNIETGEAENRNSIISYTGQPRPDGLALDDKGYLYVTEWAGGKIDIVNTETTKKEDEIVFPCKHVTSCCIRDNILYAASAKSGDEDDAEYAGGIFKMAIG